MDGTEYSIPMANDGMEFYTYKFNQKYKTKMLNHDP